MCTWRDAPPYGPDCEHCGDTGNDPSTGFQHPGYDELGCPLCNEPDGIRCCVAQREDVHGTCGNCGHPVEPVSAS